MKKTLLSISGIFIAMIFLASCGHNVDVVESGTYDGTVAEAKPEEKEIYVDLDNGKTIELYFTESTTLTKDGEEVEFSELAKGVDVQVEVEKKGKKLEPIAVKIK